MQRCRERPQTEHVPVAGFTEHLPDATQFRLEAGGRSRFKMWLEERQRGAQPADGNAHLVYTLCLAGQRSGPVHEQVAEFGEQNLPERLGGGDVLVLRDGRCLFRRGSSTIA